MSHFLALKKYKVMNVPLVPEVVPPKELYRVDPKKCVGLKINPQTLNKIRKEPLTQLGLKDTVSYANDRRIQEELEYFNEIITNICCPVIDISEMAIVDTENEV